MNDEDGLSNEERSANVAKSEAEAKKAIAEAEKALAEARKANAEADQAELSVRLEHIEVSQAEYAADNRAAGDEFHHIYRFIGEVDSDSVNRCVKKLTQWSRLDPGCDIEIIFDSPGGAVIPGLALFDYIRSLSNAGHHITTGATGMAASMGGVLVQAGDHRWMSAEAWMMIHRAAFGAIGKTFEIEDKVEWIKRIEGRIVSIFCANSKLTPQKVKRNWHRKDWWLSSNECLELRLIDEITGGFNEGMD
jgi:ATP-dependent Clp endopeptidase proteolytic subunit ClpP